MEAAITNLILTILLVVCVVILCSLWLKNRRLKKKVKKMKQGTYPLSLLDKILIALRLKVPPRPPHGGFKKGDVNIRVW